MKKYILFGLGEIILVVAGILIALQIDNWNEERKQHNALNNILSTIADDMKTDTMRNRIVIQYYERRKPLFEKLLNNELSYQEVKDCAACHSLLSGIKSADISDRGYNQLRDFRSTNEMINDTLINHIVQVYDIYDQNLTLFDKQKNDDIFENLKHWRENYDWFSSFMSGSGNLPESYYKYVYNSPEFKNKLAWHSILVYSNYIPILKRYDLNIRSLLDRINIRLEKK